MLGFATTWLLAAVERRALPWNMRWKRTMMDRPLRLRETIAWGFAGLGCFLGIWTLLTVSGLVPRQFLPTPLDVVARFVQLLDHAVCRRDLAAASGIEL